MREASAAPAGTGADIPRMGLDTYGRTADAGLASLRDALAIGYRHFDTAQS